MSETTDRADFLAAHEAMMRERWPEGIQTRDLTSAFGTTRVWVAGSAEAPPLILFAAHQATTAAWGNLASALQGDRRLYAVDLMGDAGRSVPGSRPIATPEDQVEWIDSVLDGLDLERAELAGHSYGAWIVMNYALQRPGRVTRMVLLDPTMTFGPLSRRYVLRAIPVLLRPTSARGASLIHWESRGRDLDPQWMRVRSLATEAFPQVPTVPTKVPAGAAVTALDVPALVVLAGESRVHPSDKVATRARARLRQGRVEVVPDATHYRLPISHADEIAALIRS